MNRKRIMVIAAVIVLLLLIAVKQWLPNLLSQQINPIKKHNTYPVSQEAKTLHASIFVGDWHADTTLWDRDLSKRHSEGHVDIPRLQAGNVALQMFTSVTKSPSDLNYDHNVADANDDITKLAVAQFWPIATWTNLTERALYQASKINDLAQEHPDTFKLIQTQEDLTAFLVARKQTPNLVAGLIGTEGSHALEGDIDNIQRLFDVGFRMMSLQHFFDNKLGGSLHGTSGLGLTDFGRQALVKMQEMNIIVDLSHSSVKTVTEALSISSKPVVVSHTGFKGHCDNHRNIADDLMIQIAQQGGLIAVGYWDEAVCGTSPSAIAKSIAYGVNLVGSDHVALGSDFDGAVTTPFDTSELVAITQALLDEGLDHTTIAKVMGGNMLTFLQQNLPQR